MMIRATVLALCFVMLLVTPSSARPWKPRPEIVARDYGLILDNRSNNEQVLIMWVVRPGLSAPPGSPGAAVLDATFDEHVVIFLSHSHLNPGTAESTFETVNSLNAMDWQQRSLKPLSREKLSPASNGVLTTMEQAMRQAYGKMGEHFNGFVFEAGAVRACEQGGLAVLYAGETYTWETPIPGCPKSP
jgi:hypothetical protein